jgi:hypothetical protein
MKKLCSLILFLLALTGCQQKKELSDVELVKIAREYMTVMNPGEVDKAPASVLHQQIDYDLSKGKYKLVGFEQVSFYIHHQTDRPPYLSSVWRVRIQDGKAVADVLMTPEKLENEKKERGLPLKQCRNCWGNYSLKQEWMK